MGKCFYCNNPVSIECEGCEKEMKDGYCETCLEQAEQQGREEPRTFSASSNCDSTSRKKDCCLFSEADVEKVASWLMQISCDYTGAIHHNFDVDLDDKHKTELARSLFSSLNLKPEEEVRKEERYMAKEGMRAVKRYCYEVEQAARTQGFSSATSACEQRCAVKCQEAFSRGIHAVEKELKQIRYSPDFKIQEEIQKINRGAIAAARGRK